MTKWYLSKTFYGSLLALVGVIVSGQFGIILTADQTAAIMAVIAMALRAITKEPLDW
jgi:hypothetical protein